MLLSRVVMVASVEARSIPSLLLLLADGFCGPAVLLMLSISSSVARYCTAHTRMLTQFAMVACGHPGAPRLSGSAPLLFGMLRGCAYLGNYGNIDNNDGDA